MFNIFFVPKQGRCIGSKGAEANCKTMTLEVVRYPQVAQMLREYQGYNMQRIEGSLARPQYRPNRHHRRPKARHSHPRDPCLDRPRRGHLVL